MIEFLESWMMNTEAKFIPCPFCGSEKITLGWCHLEPKPQYEVCCLGCEASSGLHDTEAEAIEYWNMRASPWKDMEDVPLHMTPVIVVGQEFGCDPQMAICKRWKSALPGQPDKYYLDEKVYRLDAPVTFSPPVIRWMPIPPLPLPKDTIS
jgi:Lar family restriction alleviation protein